MSILTLYDESRNSILTSSADKFYCQDHTPSGGVWRDTEMTAYWNVYTTCWASDSYNRMNVFPWRRWWHELDQPINWTALHWPDPTYLLMVCFSKEFSHRVLSTENLGQGWTFFWYAAVSMVNEVTAVIESHYFLAPKNMDSSGKTEFGRAKTRWPYLLIWIVVMTNDQWGRCHKLAYFKTRTSVMNRQVSGKEALYMVMLKSQAKKKEYSKGQFPLLCSHLPRFWQDWAVTAVLKGTEQQPLCQSQ